MRKQNNKIKELTFPENYVSLKQGSLRLIEPFNSTLILPQTWTV